MVRLLAIREHDVRRIILCSSFVAFAAGTLLAAKAEAGEVQTLPLRGTVPKSTRVGLGFAATPALYRPADGAILFDPAVYRAGATLATVNAATNAGSYELLLVKRAAEPAVDGPTFTFADRPVRFEQGVARIARSGAAKRGVAVQQTGALAMQTGGAAVQAQDLVLVVRAE